MLGEAVVCHRGQVKHFDHVHDVLYVGGWDIPIRHVELAHVALPPIFCFLVHAEIHVLTPDTIFVRVLGSSLDKGRRSIYSQSGLIGPNISSPGDVHPAFDVSKSGDVYLETFRVRVAVEVDPDSRSHEDRALERFCVEEHSRSVEILLEQFFVVEVTPHPEHDRIIIVLVCGSRNLQPQTVVTIQAVIGGRIFRQVSL